nr:uncharacterized mitochondrial protein AtMg00810-like [Tanacetum cinerariifolium]
MMDYALWDIIENGNFIPKTQTVKNVKTVIPPTTADEKLQRRNEAKARSTLMMGLPNEHQLFFNSFKDAKSLLAAIEKSNGVSTAQGVNTVNEVNTASFQVNAASALNIDNLSDAVICAFLASQPNSTKLVNEDLEQIHPNDLDELDLKWQMAMLTMRARRFLKNTGRKLNLTGNDSVAFDKTKVECYICHKRGYFARECQALRGHDNRSRNVTRKTVPVKIPNSLAWVNTAKPKAAVNAAKAKAKYNTVKGEKGNVFKALACWGNPQVHLQDKGVIESVCSRHMTGNMSFLIDYEEINGGYVAFGGNPKGGKITCKENLMNLRVKVIRCGNGIEFKNREMNQFCEVKVLQPRSSGVKIQDLMLMIHKDEFMMKAQVHVSKSSIIFDVQEHPQKNIIYKITHVVPALIPLDIKPGYGSPLKPKASPNHLGKFDRKADEGFFRNLDSTFQVNPILTTRIHKDHALEQVIGDLYSAPQTRRMTKNLEEDSLVGTVILRTDNKDLQKCLFACFLSQMEPKKRKRCMFANHLDLRILTSQIKSTKLKRPDIMFVVCACARYQVTPPKVSHLHDVKRIFRYLKGQPKLGLWYPKDSPFDLVAYTDSDYAGASLDRKSTTGGCQFFRYRLISWQCIKQIVVANSTTEAEYVATLSCCGQITVKIKIVNDDVRLQTLLDGKKVVITEASIKHDLKLNDAEGTSCLSNAVIFEELARMGYGKPSEMLTFYKAFFPPQWKFFIHTILQWFSRAVTPLFGTMMVQAVKEVGNLPTDVQDTSIPDAPSSSQPHRKTKLRRKERKETKVSPTEIHTKDHVPTTSNDRLPSGEYRMQLKELIDLCTNLSNKVLELENEVIKMKSSYNAKITELESRVEKLEEENKSLTKELKSFNTRVESLAIKETIMDKEESSKQGRKIADIDADADNLDMAHEEIVLSIEVQKIQSS